MSADGQFWASVNSLMYKGADRDGQNGNPSLQNGNPRLEERMLALALMVREPPRRRAPPRQNRKSGRPAAIPGHGIEASITTSEMPKKMSAC